MEASTFERLDFGSLLSEAEYLGTRAQEGVLESTRERIWGDMRRGEHEDGRQRFVSWGWRPRTHVTRWGLYIRGSVGSTTGSPVRCSPPPLPRGTGDWEEAVYSQGPPLRSGTRHPNLLRRGFPDPGTGHWTPDTPPRNMGIPPGTRSCGRDGPREGPTSARGGASRGRSFHGLHLRAGAETGQQQEVQVGIVQGQDHRMQLVGVRVEDRPGASLKGVEVRRLTTDDAPGLRALGVEHQQLCHPHFLRNLVDLLGDDGVSLTEREELVGPLRGVLAHLRNSVDCHRRDGNGAAVTVRVRATLMELGTSGEGLLKGGCPRSGRFVLKEMRSLVVFGGLEETCGCPPRRMGSNG